MGVGRRGSPAWILKCLAKKVVFLVLSGEKQISLLLASLEEFWKNPLVPPSGKNPSDAHVRDHLMNYKQNFP